MSFDDLLYNQGRLALTKQLSIPFRGFDVWILENSPGPVFPDEEIKTTELSAWLKEGAAFSKPKEIGSQVVNGRLRLIYQRWPQEHHIAGTNILPMSEKELNEITKALNLPRCFLFDFASQKDIPLRLKRYASQTCIGLVWQSPPLQYAFMIMALSYDQSTHMTCAYLGFQSSINAASENPSATPGDRLLRLLELFSNKTDNPMLLPALASGLWVEHFQHGNYRSAKALREIQADIGLMGPYVNQNKLSLKRESTEHGYLTNGVSEFLTDLFPSTSDALAAFHALRFPHLQQHGQQSIAYQIKEELDDYVEHMRIRAKAELQHRDRMLSRMNVYFQVLYSLMQQQVARETKRDSSAMKSIGLLTMVFLPATAIATIISSFVKLDADETRLIMPPQFYIFWAVSAPVTVVVLILWIVWLQRAEIARIMYKRSIQK